MSAITGIGIDLEEISRIEVMLDRWGRHFTEKVFSDDEIAYCERKRTPAQHFAARFAAKEAFAKALGTGWRGGFRWKDIEVLNDADGKPDLYLRNDARTLIQHTRIVLSLAHTKTHVVAVVVFQQADEAH
jgi:holo-[acyl-carrier protein] synthase